MAYVYAIAFDNGIVKFGRTSNMLKRLSQHMQSAAQHDGKVGRVFLAHVMDDASDERYLVDLAENQLNKVSRESFKFENLAQIYRVFSSARISPFILNVLRSPLRMIVDDTTFTGDLYGVPIIPTGAFGEKRPATDAMAKMRHSVAQVMSEYGEPMTLSSIKSRMPTKKANSVEAAVQDMVREGSVASANHPTMPYPQYKKYWLTELASKLY